MVEDGLLIRGFEQGRCLLARLDHGAEIISQIADLAKLEKVETGVCSAIGALSGAELAYYDQVSFEYRKIPVVGRMELVSCTGNISLRDGLPFVHAHAVLADRDGKTVAGHLTRGIVFAAEICLQELRGQTLNRERDPTTRLYLWGEA